MRDLTKKLKDVLASMETSGDPFVVTDDARPRAVLLTYEDYDALTKQASTGHFHITRDPGISGGEPIIQGTRISVRHIIERVQAGQTIDEILAALSHLTVAQVYAALSYYHDHQSEIDRLIEESRAEQVLASQGLRVELVGDGIAIVHDALGRW